MQTTSARRAISISALKCKTATHTDCDVQHAAALMKEAMMSDECREQAGRGEREDEERSTAAKCLPGGRLLDSQLRMPTRLSISPSLSVLRLSLRSRFQADTTCTRFPVVEQ
jgi:hypothetical protein